MWLQCTALQCCTRDDEDDDDDVTGGCAALSVILWKIVQLDPLHWKAEWPLVATQASTESILNHKCGHNDKILANTVLTMTQVDILTAHAATLQKTRKTNPGHKAHRIHGEIKGCLLVWVTPHPFGHSHSPRFHQPEWAEMEERFKKELTQWTSSRVLFLWNLE